MLSNTSKSAENNSYVCSDNKLKAKHFHVSDITYKNNSKSNYTEKIRQLEQDFEYQTNQDYYWSQPEFSLLYGTPLYREASSTQKLALNHLYWAAQYNYAAASEASGVVYFQITAGVFNRIKGYETIGREINLETQQEKTHFTAFRNISYKTKLALLGKEALYSSIPSIDLYPLNNFGKLTNYVRQTLSSQNNVNYAVDRYSYQTARYLHKQVFKQKKQYYSSYLQKLETDSNLLLVPSSGVYGIFLPKLLLTLVALSWGSSPFLACHYYSFRYTANTSLKKYEYPYYKYYKNLSKKGEFLPAPTAISYYHFLDESFHMTMSQIIARDMYQDFSPPTVYEKLIANWITQRIQTGILSGLSGCVPTVFRNDSFFIPFFYRILRSPIFNMSITEAFSWIEKCCCQEHDGFYENSKHHQQLLIEQRKLYTQLDYLQPINREMKIMASGASIEKNVQENYRAIAKFKELILS